MSNLLKSKTLGKRILAALITGSMFISIFTSSGISAAAEENSPVVESSLNIDRIGNASRSNVYADYLKKYENASKPNEEIVIEATSYASTAANSGSDVLPVLEVSDYEGVADCLRWRNNEGQITYEFNVKTSGLYNLEAVYHPTSEIDSVTGINPSNVIEMAMLLDGNYPFSSAKTFSFDRYWKDSSSIRKDAKDNDLRPIQERFNTWITYPIKDKEGLFNEPYFFYLEAGQHTLTFQGIKVMTVFKSFTFKNYDQPPAYSSIKPTEEQIKNTPALSNSNPNEIGSNTILIQTENSLYKTVSKLYPTYDRASYHISPSHPTKQRLNTIGGETWNKSTEAIAWEFSVPNDGYYRFSLKARQKTMRGFFSNRCVYIDDVVPCEEFLDQKFKYDANWYTQTLTDKNGEDIYIFLKAGKHVLRLEAVPGDIGAVMQRLEEIIYSLNYYYRRILMITGPNPDPYNDYYVDREIPELIPTFIDAIDKLYAERDSIEALSKKAGSGASSLVTLARILQICVDKRDDIPSMRGSIKDSISSVSAWMREYRDQPLELDYIEVATAAEEFGTADSNFFNQFIFNFNAFIGSFFEDYTVLSEGAAKSLNVWVSQGRDQAIVVKEIVESEFNPNNPFEIQAAINLVQGSILEATLAGKGPDIAVFIGGDFPIQLAARDLLVDIKQFKDYDEVVKERFTDNITTLYTYHDGVYGLPVTQVFPMLFYRTDILEEIGVEVPETWDEFIEIIPVLQRTYLGAGLLPPAGNMSSSIFESSDTFAMLLLQTGNNFYTEDLSRTTYDKQEVIEVFEKWTKFYTIYNFDTIYDPFTRFRTGEMPLLIQNYTFYNQLSVAAPEIKGLWDFTSVPGTKREDGTVSHAAGSASSGAIIFNKVSDQNAAWEFIKWFTSTEIQSLYGQQIEALMGPLGRFETANMVALERLPWSTAEFKKIHGQMVQTVEIPIIPASYATTRHTKNALRSVVDDKDSPRYTLENFNRDINGEIERKNKELESFNK